MKRIATVLVLCSALAAAACGDDDEAGDSGSTGTTTAATSATATTSTAEEPGAYPEQVRKNFVAACERERGATRSGCECTLAEVEERVPLDEFLAFEEQLREDPDARPPAYQELVSAAKVCAKQQ